MKKLITHTHNKAFTLVELMVTIGIVAVLATIAVPVYIKHVKTAAFNQIIQHANVYKIAVASCIERTKGLTACDAGVNGISSNITEAQGNLASLSVLNGIITSTAISNNHLNSETYILTPTYVAGKAITWTATGTACTSLGISC